MKLFTGKAEQDFEDWYYDNELIYDVCTKLMDDMTGNIQMFYKLPLSMQSGVYMEWLRSVGVIVEVTIDTDNGLYVYEIYQKDNYDNGGVTRFYDDSYYLSAPFVDNLSDHNTAQTEAIKQAGEIYNERETK